MRRCSFVAAAIVTLFAVAPAAWAKGPTGATIEGPGMREPVEIEGTGERGTGTQLAELVEAAGFWQLVAGAEGYSGEIGEIVPAPKTNDLGPLFTLTWHLGEDRVSTGVYPEAPGGPMVHMAAQTVPFLDTKAAEQWFAADRRLTGLLEQYGVPVAAATAVEKPDPTVQVAAPATEPPVASPAPAAAVRDDPGLPIAGLAAGAVAIVLAVVVLRRRPGRAGAS